LYWFFLRKKKKHPFRYQLIYPENKTFENLKNVVVFLPAGKSNTVFVLLTMHMFFFIFQIASPAQPSPA
jgi:hypothetical protein